MSQLATGVASKSDVAVPEDNIESKRKLTVGSQWMYSSMGRPTANTFSERGSKPFLRQQVQQAW